MTKKADILGVARKFRTAVRNNTGTSLSADEVKILLQGRIVSAIYRLEEEQELTSVCPEQENRTGPISLATAGSGSGTSRERQSGASAGMTSGQELRAVNRRGFGVRS